MKLARTPVPIWQRWLCGVLALAGVVAWGVMLIAAITLWQKLSFSEGALMVYTLLGVPIGLWVFACVAIKGRWPKVFIEFYRKNEADKKALMELIRKNEADK